jgi:arsenic resistance protein ArsH
MSNDDLPNLNADALPEPDRAALGVEADRPPAKILLLYGSLRERSFSRLTAEEAARILRLLGAQTRIFNPSGLPLPDDADPSHPKVAELRELATWADGFVWSSPERHGSMTGIMKAQIDWIPLNLGGVRPDRRALMPSINCAFSAAGCA